MSHLYGKAPRGIDVNGDIQRDLPNFRMNTIFDVGANKGQSARSYLNNFPNARLYCFEPVTATFAKLQNAVRGRDNVSTFRMALGAAKGTGKMVLKGSSDLFYLQKDRTNTQSRLEEVEIETLDGFCAAHGIDHIDYLKIDTEGGDYDVLTGGIGLLSEQRVDLIELEAGMNPGNKRHVPFEKLKTFLEQRRYYLFGLYEQAKEWPTNEPHLRRANPVFISEKMIRANTGKRAEQWP